jgi:hypothetical protein
MKLFLIYLVLCTAVFSQNHIDHTKLRSEFALQKSKEKFKTELDNKIKSVFASPLNRNNEKSWRKVFKEIGLLLYKNEEIYKGLEKAAGYVISGSEKFKLSFMETVITLYPSDFDDTADTLFATTKNPTLFAYLVHYYLNKNIEDKNYFVKLIKKRFHKYETIPQLKFLLYNLQKDSVKTPPLQELLSHNFMKGETIIYTLQRKDRRYPGITIIKSPDGKFVREKNDSIFYVKQLALSVTNLPGYLSQGNTPEGIFSIVGFYNSPTPSIGPTAAVLTRIPFEVPTKLWYHNSVKTNYWNIADYKSLLPETWQNYLPMYEAFYAGKTGRRKIVMHGSVDDLSFYKGLPYYPLTPSKGCLTTIELWDEKTGQNIRSDQAKLMNAFFSTKKLTGFLIVVNIDNKKMPVTIDEILPYITNY